MNARVRIDRLRLHAFHGVMPQERACGNDFEVSIEMEICGYDGSDNLESTVNYAEVIDAIRREMAQPSDLIEHVAARIASAIRQEFPAVGGGSVTVAKLLPPVAGAQLSSVSATIPI